MAKQIKGTDIIEDGHLDNAISQANKYLEVLKEIDATLRKTAIDAKKASESADLGKAQDIQKVNQALQQSNQTKKASLQLDEKIAKAETQLSVLDKKRATELAKVRLETQRANKAAKEQAILTSRTSTEYEKASVRLNQMRRRLKELVLVEGEGSKKTRQMARDVQKLDARLKKADARAGQFQRSVGNYGKALGRAGAAMRSFGASLIAFVGARQVFNFFKNSVDAFRTQEKAVAKVEQAIKSTGGAAQRTAEDLQDMARALQENTLFGDEQILNEVTAQLLTFTNISGEQFDRTQKVALDLATVLDGDLKSASIQLGKALNDPIANLSALSRSGIQFSTEQKTLIKSLAETGKLAEAQAVILDELEKQYGGQAEAAADADGGIQQLKNTFGDLMEVVGEELVKAMKPALKNLKNLIENLDEKRVRSFAKRVGEFVAFFIQNLPTIIDFAGKFLKIVVAWKVSMKAAALAAKLFGQQLSKMRGAFGILGLAVLAVVEVVKTLRAQWLESNRLQNKFKELQEEVTAELAKETSQMFKYKAELLSTNAASEERQIIIDKINEQYGTTLENLEDETEFMKQLTAAYKDYVTQLERRIQAKVLEKQILETTEALFNLNRQIADVETPEINRELLKGIREDLEGDLEEFQKTLFLLQQQGVETNETLNETVDVTEELGVVTGATGKTLTEEEKKLKRLTEFRAKQAEILKQLESDFIALGLDRESIDEEINKNRIRMFREEAEFVKSLNLETDKELRDVRNKYLKFVEKTNIEIADRNVETIKRIQESQEEFSKDIANVIVEMNKKEGDAILKRREQFRKWRDESIEIFKQITEAQSKEIDKRIENRNNEIADANNNITRLQDLAAQGNVDAAEAIKAERIRISKEKLEIEALEKRKRNLLIVVTALEKANQNIGQGDNNAFANASTAVKDFLAGLPSFSEGTAGTVAQALGKTNTKDGHVVRVDDKEHILSIRDSERLHRAGLTSNEAIVSAAMAAQNNAMSGRIMHAAKPDVSIQELREIKAAIKNFKPVEVTQQHIDFIKGLEIIKKGNKTIKNDYNNNWKV